MKKFIGILIILLVVTGIGLFIWKNVKADYEWNNEVLSNWSLSDKASTIAAKSAYIDKFIAALQSASLADNNALIYKTADNNCQNNVQAVTTLRDRLDEIKGMDENSFQYQQAIQQITDQEQGQADMLLDTLSGCWMKANHYFLWNGWYNLLTILGVVIGLVVGMVLIATNDE